MFLIISKPKLSEKLWIGFFIFVLGIIFLTGLDSLLSKESNRLESALLTLMGLLGCGMYGSFLFSLERIEISREGITLKSRISNQNLKWIDVDEILADVTKGSLGAIGQLTLISYVGTQKHEIIVQVSQHKYSDELIKYIAEAAYLTNPEVKLHQYILKDFGMPPYGVWNPR